MKKRLILICLATIVCVGLILPAGAQTQWTNTQMVIISHCYVNEGSECSIDIFAYSGATISNVDIRFDIVVSGIVTNIAQWNDLSSSSNRFSFYEFVSDVEPYYSYRLSFTAEVWRNGVVEYLDLHKDVYYYEGMLEQIPPVND